VDELLPTLELPRDSVADMKQIVQATTGAAAILTGFWAPSPPSA
jgi:hypothetical protein